MTRRSESEKDIMKNINKIPVFAVIVVFSWIISYHLIIVSYYMRKNIPCNFEPKDGTFVKQDENDTTDYMSTSNGDCFCNKVKCMRKCCPENEGLYPVENDTKCLKDNLTIVFSSLFPYYIIENVTEENLCPAHNKPEIRDVPEGFTLEHDGNLRLYERLLDYKEYCLIDDLYISICEPSNDTSKSNVIGMIISIPFLVVTFLVYLVLPEKNVHRRALINYVFSLLCGYIFQVVVYHSENAQPVPCQLLGYGLVLFFTASFFWLNVLCIDMWLAFTALRDIGGQMNTETKKFILFCIYAWGMPMLLILLIYLLNLYADHSVIYYPGLGEVRCFLLEGYPTLLYFYLPMAILIAVNAVLCILTAIKIQKVKKETSVLKVGDNKRHSYEKNKQKFKFFLKIIFATGINWSLEVISWFIHWQFEVPVWVWVISDFTNSAYGVIIFVIFVCNKNIWIQLKKRYYIWRGQPHLAHSFSSTQARRTSSISASDLPKVSRLPSLEMKQVSP